MVEVKSNFLLMLIIAIAVIGSIAVLGFAAVNPVEVYDVYDEEGNFVGTAYCAPQYHNCMRQAYDFQQRSVLMAKKCCCYNAYGDKTGKKCDCKDKGTSTGCGSRNNFCDDC